MEKLNVSDFIKGIANDKDRTTGNTVMYKRDDDSLVCMEINAKECIGLYHALRMDFQDGMFTVDSDSSEFQRESMYCKEFLLSESAKEELHKACVDIRNISNEFIREVNEEISHYFIRHSSGASNKAKEECGPYKFLVSEVNDNNCINSGDYIIEIKDDLSYISIIRVDEKCVGKAFDSDYFKSYNINVDKNKISMKFGIYSAVATSPLKDNNNNEFHKSWYTFKITKDFFDKAMKTCGEAMEIVADMRDKYTMMIKNYENEHENFQEQ